MQIDYTCRKANRCVDALSKIGNSSDVAFVLFQTSPLVMDKILSLSNLCHASFLSKKKKEVNKVFIPNIFFDWKVYLFFNWLKVNKNIIVPRKWGFEKFYTSKKEKEGGKTNPKTLWIWTLFIYIYLKNKK